MTKSRSVLTGVVLGLFVMVACLFGFAGCNTAKVTGIALELDSNATAVKQGEKLDLSSLKVKLVKSDKSSSEIVNTKYDIVSQPDTSKLGVQQLKIEYKYDDETTYSVDADIWVYGAFDKISVDEDSYSKTMNKTDSLITDDLVIYAEYECDSVKGNYKKLLTITEDNCTITQTNDDNAKKVTVYYNDGTISGTAEFSISFVTGYSISGWSAPSLVTEYNTNSARKNTYVRSSSDTSTTIKGFEVTGNMYKVGSYNKFWFQPTLQIMNSDTETSQTTQVFLMSAKVSQLVGDEYVELTGTARDLIVSYDENYHWFQFSDRANDKQFKLEVYPAGELTEVEKSKVKPISFEFQVVDGYNVYNAQDLSAIDNTNLNGKWNDLKKKWVSEGKVNTDDLFKVSTSTFILHNNISITRDDIPASQFWSESEVAGAVDAEQAVGSLKDHDDLYDAKNPHSYVYGRTINADINGNGGTFKLEGNYFDISASEVPLIYRELSDARTDANEAITVHTTLFAIVSDKASRPTVEQIQAKVTDSTYTTFEQAEQAISAKAYINNTSFTGNSGKSEDALVSGGIIMVKTDNVISTYNNCLAQRWYTAFFNNRADVNMNHKQFLTMTLNQSNGYDSYNCLVYSWGSSVNIKDSHLIGAGGPAMIVDHVNEDKADGGSPSDVVIDADSVIESYIVGTEGWFNTYTAANTLVAALKGQNRTFQSSGKTICHDVGTSVDGGKINLIGAFKGGSAQDATNTLINTNCDIEGADVNLELKKGDTYKEITKLVVISRVLDTVTNGTTAMDTLVKPYMEYMASQGQKLTIYQAVQSLFAFAQTSEPSDETAKQFWQGANALKNVYEQNLANALAACESTDEATYKNSVKYAVSIGIVYVASNGMVCVPTDPKEASGWAIAPNEDLLKEANGILYAYIYGSIGAILTISDYATE